MKKILVQLATISFGNRARLMPNLLRVMNNNITAQSGTVVLIILHSCKLLFAFLKGG